MLGILPVVLLHGTGASGYDEILIFGGIGLVILVLVYLSWRAGKKNKRERSKRRRPR